MTTTVVSNAVPALMMEPGLTSLSLKQQTANPEITSILMLNRLVVTTTQDGATTFYY